MDGARDIIGRAAALGAVIATAESCTGGMVAAALTDVPGSSAAFDRGLVTYSNTAKHELLGVDPAVVAAEGAVSEAVVREMAAGAAAGIRHDGPRLAIAVSGIAGPDGGGPGKPVGLGWFALARIADGDRAITAAKRVFDGDRQGVRAGATKHALTMLLSGLADLA